MSQDEVQLGRYRHYKKKPYTVLGLVPVDFGRRSARLAMRLHRGDGRA